MQGEPTTILQALSVSANDLTVPKINLTCPVAVPFLQLKNGALYHSASRFKHRVLVMVELANNSANRERPHE